MPDIEVRDEGFEINLPPGKKLTISADGGDVVIGADGTLAGAIESTGTHTGNVIGYQTLGTATVRSGADAPNLVIDPASRYVSLTKASAGAYTLAAPGAANVGNRMVIIAGSAQAHVVTVTGGAGGNTLTFTAAIGAAVELLAVSATVWGYIGLGGAALSTV
jgi:hypothetical protein